MSLKEQLKKVAALRTKTVKLPNGEIEITEMDAQGRIAIRELMAAIYKKQEANESAENLYFMYQIGTISFGLRENGKLIYDATKKEDRDEILQLGGDTLYTLQEEILELSGFNKAEKK